VGFLISFGVSEAHSLFLPRKQVPSAVLLNSCLMDLLL